MEDVTRDLPNDSIPGEAAVAQRGSARRRRRNPRAPRALLGLEATGMGGEVAQSAGRQRDHVREVQRNGTEPRARGGLSVGGILTGVVVSFGAQGTP